jgi:hypothetical protein
MLIAGEAAAGWTQTTATLTWADEWGEVNLLGFQEQLWCGISGSGGFAKSLDGTQWDPPISVPWQDAISFDMVTHAGGIGVIGAERFGPVSAFFSDDGLAWVRRGNAPDLWYHTTLSFNGRLWVLGGARPYYDEKTISEAGIDAARKEGGSYQKQAVNSVFSSETGSQWQVEPDAPWSRRTSHSSVVFDSKMWVMGGFTGASGVPANDVWRSADGITWIEVTPEAAWNPRAGHASVVFGGKIWILGGFTRQGNLNDVWCSTDGVLWTQVTEHAPWEARYWHSCTVYQHKVWLAGGVGSQWFRDVWMYEPDAEGEGAVEGEGEGSPVAVYHTADQNQNQRVDLSEILRVIQFYNLGDFRCAIPPESTEDGYAPGVGDTSCAPHDSDYAPQDWRIGLSELLRLIQFFNTGGYSYCPESSTEDGFCPGLP